MQNNNALLPMKFEACLKIFSSRVNKVIESAERVTGVGVSCWACVVKASVSRRMGGSIPCMGLVVLN